MAVPLIALILEGDFIRHVGSGQDATGNFRKPSPLNKFLVPMQNKNVPATLSSLSRQLADVGCYARGPLNR
jgi:hypothetical protein